MVLGLEELQLGLGLLRLGKRGEERGVEERGGGIQGGGHHLLR